MCRILPALLSKEPGKNGVFMNQLSGTWKFLSFLQKHLVWTIPAVMLAGVLAGSIIDMKWAKSLILPLTFLMVYPMMVNLPLKQLTHMRGWKLQATAMALNFTIIPLLAWGVARLFFPGDPMFLLGILLIGLLPTSGMTVSWTGFTQANVPGAVRMMVLGLLLGALLTPFYLSFFISGTMDLPLAGIFQQILLVVFFPLILGFLTRVILLKKMTQDQFQKTMKPRLPLVSTLGVLGMVFLAMALKAPSITAHPAVLFKYAIPLLSFYAVAIFVSTLVAKIWFERADALALVFGTVLRNLSISLALAMTVLGTQGAEMAIVISMAFIIQVQVAAWYARLSQKIWHEGDAESLWSKFRAGKCVFCNS